MTPFSTALSSASLAHLFTTLSFVATLGLHACGGQETSDIASGADTAAPTARTLDRQHKDAQDASPKKTSPVLEERVGPTEAGLLIAALDARIAAKKARIQKQQDNPSWLEYESMALAYIHRARYTHSWEDWASAEATIDQAFALARDGSGPFLTRASLYFSLHRFDEASRDLDQAAQKILLKNTEKADILARKAEIAFQRGELDQTRTLLEEASNLDPASPSIQVQRGWLAMKTGDLETARERMDAALSLIRAEDASMLAWARLQRGVIELESGNVEQANALFARADKDFSGWYLIEEHLAETHAILGHHDVARQIYESVVARVSSGPFFEALAETCHALQDKTCAAHNLALATQTYLSDLENHPQSAYGHAMDFFLQGEDTALMLEIARGNHTLRPGHDAATKLAQAHIRAGDLQAALPLLERALQAGWSTADLHATAATLYALLEDPERARAQRKLALRRHPESMQDISWLTPIARRSE